MSESRVVSAASIGELLAEVKLLMADGWKVKGVVSHDTGASLYSQTLEKA